MTDPAQRERQFGRDEVIWRIAGQLDLPSLYMSGPSPGSRRKAEQDVALLETLGVLSFGETP